MINVVDFYRGVAVVAGGVVVPAPPDRYSRGSREGTSTQDGSSNPSQYPTCGVEVTQPVGEMLQVDAVGATRGGELHQGNPSHGALGSKQEPHGFFVMGNAMNLRPHLVAWSEASEWRTRCPNRITNAVLTHQ
jgi:hypothetical protein